MGRSSERARSRGRVSARAPASLFAGFLSIVFVGVLVAGCGKSADEPAPSPPTERPDHAVSVGPGASPGGERRNDTPITDAERGDMPGLIAFVSERAGTKDVWLTRPTGDERPLTSGPEDEFPAAPAPDGSGLLVVATRDHDGTHLEQIRWVPLDGGPAQPIEAPRGRARSPAWAPDGRWFVAESDARGFSDLVRLTASANAVAVPLATAPQGNFQPSVSPDGSHIAFASSREGDPEIYVMQVKEAPVDGTGKGATGKPDAEPRRLTAFHKEDWAPQWSPDGQWIAFLSTREDRPRGFVVRPDGTDTRPLSGKAATGEERDLAWHPDSQSLVLVGRQANGTTRIWRTWLDGRAPVPLTDGSHRDDQPAWSPDGKYLVFVSERDGNTDLYMMRADGSGRIPLTQSPGPDWLPRWFTVREAQ